MKSIESMLAEIDAVRSDPIAKLEKQRSIEKRIRRQLQRARISGIRPWIGLDGELVLILGRRGSVFLGAKSLQEVADAARLVFGIVGKDPKS